MSTQLVWAYHLDYGTTSNDTKRSWLRTVQLCVPISSCSWKRRFEWTTSIAANQSEPDYIETTNSSDPEFDGPSLSRDAGALFTYLSTDANYLPPTDVQLLLFDADGDGIDDALYRTKPTDITFEDQVVEIVGVPLLYVWNDYKAGQIKFRHSTDAAPLSEKHDVTSLFEPYTWAPPPELPTTALPQPDVRWPPLGKAWVARLGKSRVADLDGDGVANLLLARTRLEENDWWQEPTSNPVEDDPNPSVISNINKWWFGYADFDKWPLDQSKSDKIDNFSLTEAPVFRDSSAGSSVGPSSPSFTTHLFTPQFQRILVDLNGDGRVEAVDAFQVVSFLGQHLQYEDWTDLHLSHQGDFPYKTFLASEDPAPPPANYRSFGHWTCGNGKLRVSDVDGDGRDDLLAMNVLPANQGQQVMLAYERLYLEDSGWPGQAGAAAEADVSELRVGDCKEYDPDLILADFNGDGLEECAVSAQVAGRQP